jgi:oligopeptide transport system permease protein
VADYPSLLSGILWGIVFWRVNDLRKYVLKRLGISAITLLVILLVLFLMLEFMPGSPFNDEKITQAQRAVLDAKYGLDQPVLARFFNYIKAMLSGDFGLSYVIQKNMPISTMLSARLPVSLQIGAQAVLLGTLIGLILGIVAALRHNSFIDSLTTFISVIGVSFPSYVFALGLSYFLGSKLKWFPILYTTAKPFVSTILPTVALAMFTVATVARFARSEMIEVLGSEYMLLSESKGVDRKRLIFVHALRNALIPIITVLAPLVVGLMTGSLVIEQIFSIPGIGSLLVTAIQVNDYNVIIAVTFIYSIMFIGLMLLVDVLYGVIDPRIRLAKGEKRG